MGRAADNEKIKLRAAFYNNLAVAFLQQASLSLRMPCCTPSSDL
jgi:hypothetical protein